MTFIANADRRDLSKHLHVIFPKTAVFVVCQPLKFNTHTTGYVFCCVLTCGGMGTVLKSPSWVVNSPIPYFRTSGH